MENAKMCCFLSDKLQCFSPESCKTDENFTEQLKTQIDEMIVKNGVSRFVTGMDIGFGVRCAELVLEAAKQHENISLECVLAYENVAEHYSEEQRDRFFDVMERCNRETLLETTYTEGCIQRADEYMLRKSDYIINV